MKSRIYIANRMSNKDYHSTHSKTWWVRVSGEFMEIGQIRGDSTLDITVDLPVGTLVEAGCGPTGRSGVRAKVKTAPLSTGRTWKVRMEDKKVKYLSVLDGIYHQWDGSEWVPTTVAETATVYEAARMTFEGDAISDIICMP